MAQKAKTTTMRFKTTIDNLLKDKDMNYRDFARTIGEDSADISRWMHRQKNVTTRAVLSICKIYPQIKPHDLNPELFAANLEFVWK